MPHSAGILARSRRDGLALLLLLACWAVWLPTQSAAGVLLISGCAGWLAFFRPAYALVLMAMVAPFEQSAELFRLGTLHTGELMMIAAVPGLYRNTMAIRGWHRSAVPIAIWVLPFVTVVLAAAFFSLSAHALRGACKSLETMLMLVLGVHVLRRGEDAERVVWGLAFAAMLSAGMGFWETLSGPTVHPELMSIGTARGEVVRASAGFGPNTLAVFIAMLLPFTAAAALFHPQNRMRFTALVGSFILAAGFFATFSMTGLLALLSALLVVLAGLAIGSPRWSMWLITLAAAGFAALLAVRPEMSGSAFWGTKLASLADRLDYLQVTGKIVSEHFWLGVGPGMYRFIAPLVGGSDINPIGLITHPHSYWLTVMAETGFLGLATLLLLVFRIGAYLIRRVLKLRGAWPVAAGWALVAGLAAFFTGNFTEHCLVHDRGVHAALFLAAVIVFLKRPSTSRLQERRACFREAWQTPSPVSSLSQDLAQRRESRWPLYQCLEEIIAEKKHGAILEIGCGPARDALNLAQHRGIKMVGLDISENVLALAARDARTLKRRLTLIHGDARHVPLPDGSMDAVYSQGLLEHFPSPDSVVREMVRLLKPDGRLVIDVPQTWNPYTLAKHWHMLKGDWPWGWETQFSLGDLHSLAQRHGLTVVKSRGYGYRGGILDWTLGLRRLLRPIRPRLWDWLEERTGAWWMMNLVVVLRKKNPDPDAGR